LELDSAINTADASTQTARSSLGKVSNSCYINLSEKSDEALINDYEEILQLLFEAGSSGLLPKDLVVKLQRFMVARHQVSRRILRMNKRLKKEFGEHVAEQRGWHWALTSFAAEVWGEPEKGLNSET
jgi:hypothetical protein